VLYYLLLVLRYNELNLSFNLSIFTFWDKVIESKKNIDKGVSSNSVLILETLLIEFEGIWQIKKQKIINPSLVSCL